MLNGGESKTIRQYVGVSSTIRNGEVDSATLHHLFIDLESAGGIGNFLRVVIAHPSKRCVGGAQSQEKMTLKSQPVGERRFVGAADEAFYVGCRFGRMLRQEPRNFYRPVDGFALHRFVDEAPSFSLARTKRLADKNVPKRGRHTDGAGQSLCSACARQKAEVRFRQADQVVAILGDPNITGQSKFESAGKRGAGYRGNDGLRHGFTHRHRLIEESAMVACVVRPLAARSANLFGNVDKRRNIKMAVKVSRSSTGYDNDANIVIAGKSLKLVRQGVSHRHIEIHLLGTPQRYDGDSI